MENNIIEGNNLIDDFLGVRWQVLQLRDGYSIGRYKGTYKKLGKAALAAERINKTLKPHEYQAAPYRAYIGLFTHECRYHKDWDWLMPVVEKIKSLYPEWSGFMGPELYQLIEAVKTVNKEVIWQAVVEFINWHNQQQTI